MVYLYCPQIFPRKLPLKGRPLQHPRALHDRVYAVCLLQRRSAEVRHRKERRQKELVNATRVSSVG